MEWQSNECAMTHRPMVVVTMLNRQKTEYKIHNVIYKKIKILLLREEFLKTPPSTSTDRLTILTGLNYF